MLDIVAQDIVADNVRRLAERVFELVESSVDRAFRRHGCGPVAKPHRGQIEDFACLGIDLEIDGQTALKQTLNVRTPQSQETQNSHQAREKEQFRRRLERPHRRRNTLPPGTGNDTSKPAEAQSRADRPRRSMATWSLLLQEGANLFNDAFGRALLQNGSLRRDLLFPLQVQATRTISAVPGGSV
ncbi:hypothetical protein NHN26_17000 [Rhodovulum tesquicola]|uniref:hypothetical protein n=1 Tax=Rhodovulum tesquicola TaxID=540254 RepID=UPI00209854AE|nr:hypothetical protein [Rhodovulum tesquicola]MCO8146899.1 hypothetical protein [Rhodovulum tesquicola]